MSTPLIDPAVIRRLVDEIGEDARPDEPMSRHTSFRAGGPASIYVRAKTSSALERYVPLVARTGIPWRVLGGGNNVLVADAGITGCVFGVDSDRADPEVLRELTGPAGEVVVRFPAGCKLILAAKKAVDLGLGGLEWAVGVPGTLGGSTANNAGAHGSDMAAIFVGATAVDATGAVVRLSPEDMGFAYRYSSFKAGKRRDTALISIDLRLRHESREALMETAARFEATRKQRQPPGLSAGSVFKNPPGDFSGRLIEAAGLKGIAVGGARVSDLHGNFFLNAGRATASDIYHLMRAVQDAVWDRFAVWLEPELELIGEWTHSEREALKKPSEDSTQHPAPSTRSTDDDAASWSRTAENPDYDPNSPD